MNSVDITKELKIFIDKKQTAFVIIGCCLALCIVIGFIFGLVTVYKRSLYEVIPLFIVMLLGCMMLINYLRRLVQKEPEIIISPQGIFVQRYGFLSWDTIKKVEIIFIRPGHPEYLRLEPNHSYAYFRNLPWISKFDALFLLPPIVFHPYLSIDTNELEHILQSYLKNYRGS